MGVLPMSVQTQTLHVGDNDFEVCDTSHVEGAEALPHSLRILLENVLRNVDDADARELYAKRIVDAGTQGVQGGEIEYMPARVLLQDFTGVPVFVDLAVMREAARDLGADPAHQSANSARFGDRPFGDCRCGLLRRRS